MKRRKPSGPTFAEVLERTNAITEVTAASQRVIELTTNEANDGAARVRLAVISCHGCSAPKGCCTVVTHASLREGISVAARLRSEGRDTPELRARLRASALAMEKASDRNAYNAPCVFLSGDERCTIYDNRPIECGTHFVFSPAAACSDPATTSIEKYDATRAGMIAAGLDEKIRARLGIPDQPGRHYFGPLPRVVLLCLQAWERPDYADFFAHHEWPQLDVSALMHGLD